MENNNTKTERIYLRCTPDTKKQLEEAAKKDNRTVSNLIDKIIADYLANTK